MTDFSKTKIHCSALNSIMANGRKKTNMQLYREAVLELEKKSLMFEKLKKKDGPRGESLTSDISELSILIPKLESVKDVEEPLSDGCKTYLSTVYAWEKYGKWSISKEIGSKATEKGKEVEEDSITLVSVLEGILFEKNQDRIEDDWFSGIPDFFEGKSVLLADKIHDVKSPWDIESFMSYIGKPLPMNYYWQMQGYMALTGAKVAEVHFCLVNALESQIKNEFDRLFRASKMIDPYSPAAKELLDETIKNLTFDDIPKEDRRIKFIVERNDEDIELARKRVEKCRIYLQEFETMHESCEFHSSTRKIDLDAPILQ